MQAIRVHEYGGLDVLKLEEVPVPEPGPGEARVRLQFAGVNFTDIYSRKGLYPAPMPMVPGSEGAGVVDAVGLDVTEVSQGDRVAYAMQIGAYATYAIVPAWKLVPLPTGIDAQQAAAIMLQGMTAHYLATSTYPLSPSDTALVHAAAGGTGQLLVQIAKRRGARVFGTVSTQEKAKLAREAGADEAIVYTQVDFDVEVRRLTGDRGVDVVYDGVGQATFEKSLSSLRRRGYLVLFGQASGPVPAFDPQVLNARGSLYLTRPSLGHYTAGRGELMQRALDLFAWLQAGELKVRIDKVFPLAEAARAHEYMESRQTRGKVLLALE